MLAKLSPVYRSLRRSAREVFQKRTALLQHLTDARHHLNLLLDLRDMSRSLEMARFGISPDSIFSQDEELVLLMTLMAAEAKPAIANHLLPARAKNLIAHGRFLHDIARMGNDEDLIAVLPQWGHETFLSIATKEHPMEYVGELWKDFGRTIIGKIIDTAKDRFVPPKNAYMKERAELERQSQQFSLRLFTFLMRKLKDYRHTHGDLILEGMKAFKLDACFERLHDGQFFNLGQVLLPYLPGIRKDAARWDGMWNSGKVVLMQQLADVICHSYRVPRVYVKATLFDAYDDAIAKYSPYCDVDGYYGTVNLSSNKTKHSGVPGAIHGGLETCLECVFHEIGHHLERYGHTSLMRSAKDKEEAAKLLESFKWNDEHYIPSEEDFESYQTQMKELHCMWFEKVLLTRMRIWLGPLPEALMAPRRASLGSWVGRLFSGKPLRDDRNGRGSTIPPAFSSANR